MILRTALGCRTMSMPSTRALPPLGGRRVVSILIVVLLPAPFGPRSANISPRSMARERPFTATSVENLRVSPSSSRIAMGSGPPFRRRMSAGREDAPQGGHRPGDGGQLLAIQRAEKTGKALLRGLARAGERLGPLCGDLQ